MNPSCCDVNVLVFDNVPYNIFANNLSLYVVAFLGTLIEKKENLICKYYCQKLVGATGFEPVTSSL